MDSFSERQRFPSQSSQSLPSPNQLPVPERSPSQRDKKQKKQQQPRQLLSCTKCRERKVKCDRTKPCSACCARGLPKECHFVLGEGAEFGPIQQSLELRKLRIENQRLKERLLAGRGSISDESEDDEGFSSGKSGPLGRRMSRQRRFQVNDQTDSLYFGSPGLASVIADFASLQLEPKSLSHAMPRGADMYAAHDAMYPFPTLWPAMSLTEGLLQCLPPRELIFQYIDTFINKAQGIAFPYLPEELTPKAIEHFLEDVKENAEKVPDLLAMFFAALALGAQLCAFEKNDQGNSEESTQVQGREGEIFSVAAMQALRLSSFTSRPTLRSIQALNMLAPYLTNSGRFLDAWSLFGLTIRLAHSIGLHRNPRFLDPVPSLRECTVRQTLWWWIIHMDQQYSMTLGRPLGVSGIGDCPPADPLTTDPAALRLCEFFDQLTILGRQIMSSSQLTDSRIDMFTDRLIALWDTMPDSLQFNRSWIQADASLPDWPMETKAAMYFCKIHNYIILLNRQRIENGRVSPGPDYRSLSPKPRQFSIGADYLLPSNAHYTSPSPSAPIPRGRPLVLQSCAVLLDAFVFFYKRVSFALVDWTIGQEAFNACMILLLDAFETGDLQHIGRVEQGYAIFVEMDKRKMHQLTELATSRISEGLLQLRDIIESKKAAANATDASRLAAERRHHTASEIFGHPIDWEMAPEMGGPRFCHEAVMSSTGMFLLEDHGLQTNMSRTSTPSSSSGTARPPIVPSQNETASHATKPPILHVTQFEPRRDSVHPLRYLPTDQCIPETAHPLPPPTPQYFYEVDQPRQARSGESWQVVQMQGMAQSHRLNRGQVPSNNRGQQ